MTRRVLAAIVAVATAAIVLFGVPLAVGVERLYRKEATVSLERAAARAALAVPAAYATSDDPVELPAAGAHITLALYDRAGTRVQGDGPPGADAVVRAALAGRVRDAATSGDLAVAVPLTSNERVFAAIRAATPADRVRDRAERTWLAMALLAAVVIGAAAAAARLLAGRLTRPVHDLAGTARRLGDGDFTARAATTGVAEIDAAADALNATAERLGQVLARERSFSADASHQLRTPLTALRVRLEAALLNPGRDRDDVLRDALTDIDRLHATVEDLLALARDTPADRDAVDLEAVLGDAERRWHGPLAAQGRPLRVRVEAPLPPVRASARAVTQILDVLVDNAARHGDGAVTLTCGTRLDDAVAIDVADEGPGPPAGDDAPFRRRAPDAAGSGIGLALARSLAQAEGGRLVLTRAGPGPVFTLFLPAAR